ncbi:MipA/OmpV family protein [Sphingomonas sp. NBWT7]|uniref:MipA/OmpV family protein n=1 Tax=Sphingomonas sp. NBWT7 TaxID=2596913 RepID=UPI00215609D0|nr:MipA/OmpV family protein [Sphingomonas sp. NBWT7]
MIARNLLIGAAVAAALPTAAVAQDAPPAEAVSAPAPSDAPNAMADFGRDTITLGLGLAYLPDYEGSNDYRFAPGPAAIGTIGGISFSVLGSRASADLIPSPGGPSWDIQLGPVAAINFMRSNRQSIEDARVRRLGERDTSIELGGYAGIGKTGVITSQYDKLSVSVSYRHDVSGVHRSGIWQPTINYFTPLSEKSALALFASAERVETKYVQTYFYVPAGQSAISGLPTYTTGRGGWKNWTVGALGTYSLTGNLLRGFKLVAGGTYRRMINDVADSPLVRIAGSRTQWLGAVGVAYTF